MITLQPGKLLPSAHAVEREFKVMSAIAKGGVPVPNMVVLCEDERLEVIIEFIVPCEYIRLASYLSALPVCLSVSLRLSLSLSF